MNNRIVNATTLIMGAFENYFKDREKVPVLPPEAFTRVCNHLAVGNDVIYLLASFALALVKGMVENPGEVTVMCGCNDTEELTAAIDEIRQCLTTNI